MPATMVRPGEGFMGCSRPAEAEPAMAVAEQESWEAFTARATASKAIFFPDISNFQAGMTLAKGTVAVIAKASEGSTFTDGTYAGFKAQAARIGAVFSAYHFLWGSSDAEVRHCHSIVGKTPLMIDAENTHVKNTISMIVAFAKAYRKLGGIVWGVYLPKWYWQGTLGSPSLAPLKAAGLELISSNYTSYSDSGPGWAAYGGMSPVQWQYTSSLRYAGRRVDFNAFKGTVGQLKKLWTGGTVSPDNSTPASRKVHMYTSVYAHGVKLKKGQPTHVQFTSAGAKGAWTPPYGKDKAKGGYNVGVPHKAHIGTINISGNDEGAAIRTRFHEVSGKKLDHHKYWPAMVIRDEEGTQTVVHWDDTGSHLWVELTADRDCTVDVAVVTVALDS